MACVSRALTYTSQTFEAQALGVASVLSRLAFKAASCTRPGKMMEHCDSWLSVGFEAIRFPSWKSAPTMLMKFRMVTTSSNMELPSDVV